MCKDGDIMRERERERETRKMEDVLEHLNSFYGPENVLTLRKTKK